MKRFVFYILSIFLFVSCNAQVNEHSNAVNMNYRKLNDFEKSVIIDKATERPFVGEYTNTFDAGFYKCKQCDAKLYESKSKFHSNCGWPSFDDEIPGAVKHIPDVDGERTEIVCASCNGHLGHVFVGEGFTEKNTRHCVNSISLVFVSNSKPYDTAYFASGCFWGTEYWFERAEGIIKTTVGYTGGDMVNPTYEDVCDGNTGHAECVEVVFDTTKTNYETLLRLYFNTHDPTQIDRQGPDIGEQYRGAIFYTSLAQKQKADELFIQLFKKGYDVATEVNEFKVFYPAEEYHQKYYTKHHTLPYCHIYKEKF